MCYLGELGRNYGLKLQDKLCKSLLCYQEACFLVLLEAGFSEDGLLLLAVVVFSEAAPFPVSNFLIFTSKAWLSPG